MSVFDPYGFLANFTITAKVIMQQLWLSKIGWDEPIPDQVKIMWALWRNDSEKVRNFKIPRHYFAYIDMCSGSPTDVELHIFVNASQNAFSAVTYLRVYNGQTVCIRLVAEKSRCSPIKELLSIPRLDSYNPRCWAPVYTGQNQVSRVAMDFHQTQRSR